MAEKTDSTGDDGKDAIKSAMSLLYEGSQEDAAEILDAEINRRVGANAGTTVDPAQLAAQIKSVCVNVT